MIEFEAIYKKYFRDVYLFILGLAKDEHVAEDVTEEAFFHAMRALPDFRGDCDIRVWLCQIAKNEYYQYLRKKEKDMRQDVSIPMDTDTKALEKISRYLFRKKVTTAVVAMLSVLLLVVLLGVHLNSPIVLPYEEVAESIKIEEGKDGRMTISMDNKGGSSEIEYEIVENGDRVQYISIYTTRWKQFTKMTAGSSSFEIETTGDNAISRVFYYPSMQNGESVCLYQAEDSVSGGVVVLPRLTLRYYTLIAILLTGVGAVACFLFRKQKSRQILALKAMLFPLIYTVSSMVVLSGRGDIYNAEYYFTGILMVTVVLYIIGYWLIEYCRYRGGNKGKVKCS